MTDISSAASSTATFITKQASDLNKAAGATATSFANVLAKVPTAIGIKPSTGFVAGPTYEANTIAGQTKAAFHSALNATKFVLHIKP